MKITGGKRWFVVALCALMAGIMVYVPFLRYSFYDQMCVLFTEYKHVVSPDTVNCILRSRADSEAFQSGRYAEHNGRPKTLKKVA